MKGNREQDIAIRSARSTDRQAADAGRHPLVAVAAVLAAGIVADRLLPLGTLTWWLLAAAALALWWAVWRRGSDRIALAALCVAVAACGASWHHDRWYQFPADDLGLWATKAAQPVCLEAVVTAEPRFYPAASYDPLRAIPPAPWSRLELRPVRLRNGVEWQRASGRVVLTANGHVNDVRAGDRVRIFAQLTAPPPRENPGGFDLAAHRRNDRQLAMLRTSHAESVTTIAPRRWWQGGGLAGLRRAGHALLSKTLDANQAELAAAILLGERRELSDRQLDPFFETGTMHLLVVSGLHVGLLAAGLFWAMRIGLVPWRTALVSVGGITVLYALLTGANPPVVRAVVMVLVVVAARLLGRRAVSWNTLAAAAVVVLALNPGELFQTGTQLSFLAVGCLVWVAAYRFARPVDPLKHLIATTRPWPQRAVRTAGRWSLDLFLASAVVWLVTLPLVMARFHVVTPLAPLLNVLLWIPVSLALVSGFGILVFGWLVPPLAQLCSAVCGTFIGALHETVVAASQLPGSHFWVPGPDGWWLGGFYIVVALALVLPRSRIQRRWFIGMIAAWIAVGLTVATVRPVMAQREGRLRCTFLAVGHGCAVVLELPDGKTLLYDAGRLGSPSTAARTIADFLWSRGLTHVDAVVLSHADVDHYNALPALIRRISCGVIYVSPMMFDRQGVAIRALGEAIDEAGVPLEEIYSPDRLRVGEGVTIDVLHPTRFGVLGSDNANSIVLAIEYRGRRILLTGDLEPPGLEAVLAEAPWDCDVLLAPHHGSAASNPAGMTAWCTPEWVFVSGSINNRSPEIERDYRSTGATVLHGGETGAVTVEIGRHGMRVERFR